MLYIFILFKLMDIRYHHAILRDCNIIGNVCYIHVTAILIA